MNEQSKLKLKLSVIILLTATMILGVIFYGMYSSFAEEYVQSIIVLIISIAMMIIAVWIFRRESKNVKAGLPLEDERSKLIKQKAAAYSYYVSLYYLLGLMWYNIIAQNFLSLPRMDTEAALGVGIGGIIILFFVIWLIVSKRGDKK